MIIKEKTKSGAGATVIDIALGDKELEVLNALLVWAYRLIPKSTETQVFISRVRTLQKQMAKARAKLNEKK